MLRPIINLIGTGKCNDQTAAVTAFDKLEHSNKTFRMANRTKPAGMKLFIPAMEESDWVSFISPYRFFLGNQQTT